MVKRMKKLNQEGWGLSTFLSFIAIIFIAILLVAHLSNKYGMGPTGTDNSSKGNEFLEKYQNYETIVKESSVKYQESHYPNIDNGDTFYVNINKLSIEEKILEECTGYVEFGIKDEIYYYSPYLKCGTYKTKGYIKNLDK